MADIETGTDTPFPHNVIVAVSWLQPDGLSTLVYHPMQMGVEGATQEARWEDLATEGLRSARAQLRSWAEPFQMPEPGLELDVLTLVTLREMSPNLAHTGALLRDSHTDKALAFFGACPHVLNWGVMAPGTIKIESTGWGAHGPVGKFDTPDSRRRHAGAQARLREALGPGPGQSLGSTWIKVFDYVVPPASPASNRHDV
jgi:hypothetical protein